MNKSDNPEKKSSDWGCKWIYVVQTLGGRPQSFF